MLLTQRPLVSSTALFFWGALSALPSTATQTSAPPSSLPSRPAPPAHSATTKSADKQEDGDRSEATLDETLKWIETNATFHEDGVGVPGMGAPAVLPAAAEGTEDSDVIGATPTASGTLIFSTDQKVTYDPANHQLVVQQRAARPGAPILQMVTTLPLDKLALTATLDRDDPNAVLLSCLPTARYFHEVGTLLGQRTDDFVGEITIRFNSVNTAERALRAFQHLATLTSGKGPIKPKNEPF